MEQFTKQRNRLLAQKVIDGLRARNSQGYFVETKEEAKELALSLMPKGSSIGWGGTMSVAEIGLFDAVKNGDYVLLDRSTGKDQAETDKILREIYSADFFLTSCNGMAEDGTFVNVDGASNRVSAIAFGPKTVIMIVGMNKIVKTADDALRRARYEAAPVNAQRFPNGMPCVKTGECYDCKMPGCICCNILTTRYSRIQNRFQVILVNEDLGF